ncbi:hypothetical protein [Streptomyces sp. M92]|uniref:hypothetical protein n=1 Tax=Streptomyces sp. M92 TaxID=2944250 RepID=UPI00234B34FC|nr:hypothetical protein [Streptomyces sp. M92]WCN03799.1 hypothetical protein M6G08_17760 [Streptomyces sp. M92]
MTAVVFIHGTRVRAPGFSALAGRFSAGVTALRDGLRVVPYYWDGEHGATLAAGGASLPPASGTGRRGPLAADAPGDDDTTGWAALYADPYAELALAAAGSPPAAELPPGFLPPGQRLRTRLVALAAEGDGPAAGLGPGLARATADLAAHPLLAAAAASLAPDGLAEARPAVRPPGSSPAPSTRTRPSCPSAPPRSPSPAGSPQPSGHPPAGRSGFRPDVRTHAFAVRPAVPRTADEHLAAGAPATALDGYAKDLAHDPADPHALSGWIVARAALDPGRATRRPLVRPEPHRSGPGG